MGKCQVRRASGGSGMDGTIADRAVNFWFRIKSVWARRNPITTPSEYIPFRSVSGFCLVRPFDVSLVTTI